MAGSGFGEHLRREREIRGVSLNEIAAATRISVRFLEGLEQEAFDRLPGGVFNRGFVRTVARYLGLEEEGLLAEYSSAVGENVAPPVPQDLPRQPLTGALRPPLVRRDTGRGDAGRGDVEEKTRTPWLAFALLPILFGLGIGGWYGWKSYESRRTQWQAAESALPTPPVPPTAPGSADANAADSGNLSSNQQLVTTGENLQLKIDASKDVSVIITADGLDAFTGTLATGQSRTVTAKNTLTIEAQDAGAVHLELNGQSLAPLGPAGQPGRLTLDHPATPEGAGGHD
jgi:cytoskeletal protein RodZ